MKSSRLRGSPVAGFWHDPCPGQVQPSPIGTAKPDQRNTTMSVDIDLHLGQRLRRRRRLLGLTQQQVANAVGIRFQQVQKYECGANRISAARLWELATALDVPVSYFFEGWKPASPPRPIPNRPPVRPPPAAACLKSWPARKPWTSFKPIISWMKARVAGSWIWPSRSTTARRPETWPPAFKRARRVFQLGLSQAYARHDPP